MIDSDLKQILLDFYVDGVSSVELSEASGIPASTIRRWAAEGGVRMYGDPHPLNEAGLNHIAFLTGVDSAPEGGGNGTMPPSLLGGGDAGSNPVLREPVATTRRCRNKNCIERFVPVNDHHFFCSPACRDAPDLWDVEDILREEGQLTPEATDLEIAKRAFGQKNQLVRKVSQLTSLRSYLRHEVRTLYDDMPELRLAPVAAPDATIGKERELIVQLSDWQIGKLENGIGVEEMKRRVSRIVDATLSIASHFRRSGYVINRCTIAYGGDMGEGCYIYAGQNVNGLDRTGNTHRLVKQIMIAAELEAQLVAALAAEFPKIFVVSVPGNHGRTNGRNDFSDPDDNFDQMIPVWAQDKCSNLTNVQWHIPENWWAGFTVFAHNVITFHGDQWRGPLSKLETLLPQWVLAGVFGGAPSLVLTHHRHDFAVMHVNGVPVVQNGTIDGGSNWYLKAFGRASKPEQTVIVASPKRVTEAIYPISF